MLGMHVLGIRIRKKHLLVLISLLLITSYYTLSTSQRYEQHRNNVKFLQVLKESNSTSEAEYEELVKSFAEIGNDQANEEDAEKSILQSAKIDLSQSAADYIDPKIENDSDLESGSIANTQYQPTSNSFEKKRASIIKAIFKMIASVKPKINYDERKLDRTQSPLDFEFLPENLLNEFLIFNDEFVESYKESHAKIVEMIKDLHFPKGLYEGDGIVMVGGDKYTWLTLVSITMMRKNGGDLPVEVIIPDRKEYEPEFCDVLLPKLNAKCLVMTDVLGENYANEIQLNKYQFKGLSLLASSFENLLLLDSDNIPVAPVTKELFLEQPFINSKMVFWPDFWKRSTSPKFYDIANIKVTNKRVRDCHVDLPPSQHYELRPKDAKKVIPFHDREGAIPDKSTESGQLMISKLQNADVVLLSLYYNAYGPTGYYPLLSQGVAGEGDKDTFPAAATVLGKEFYQVKKNVAVNGFMVNGGFRGTAMIQYDPILDYQNFLEFMEIHRKADESFDSHIIDGFLDDNRRKSALFLHANFPKLYPVELLSDFVVREDGAKRYRMYDSNEIKGNYEWDYWNVMYNYICVDKINIYYTSHTEELSTEKAREEYCKTYFKPHLDYLKADYERKHAGKDT